MAVNLSPIWGAGAQLLDNSGNVLSGGKIYTYAAGTTTQVATYTSNSGITANSNPIVLNSAGRVPYEIWLTDGQNYKFVLKDSNDVLIGTWDNLSGINSNFIAYTNQQEIQTATAGQTVFNLTTMNYLVGTNSLSVFVDGVNQYGPGAQYAYEETDSNTVTFASGLHVGAEVKFTSTQTQNAGVIDASQVGYTYPNANAVSESVETRLSKFILVTDFGAVGDGVADDTVAIENAIAAAAISVGGSTGAVVYFPTGTYLISNTIAMPNRVGLQGANGRGVLIKPHNSFSDAYMFHASNGTSSMFGSWIKDIHIDARGKNMTAVVWTQAWQETSGMERVVIQFDGTTNCGLLYTDGYGGASYCKCSDCEIFSESTYITAAGVLVGQVSLVGGFVFEWDGGSITGGVGKILNSAIRMVNDSLLVKLLHCEYVDIMVTMSGAGGLSADTLTGSFNAVTNMVVLSSTFTGVASLRNMLPNGTTTYILRDNVSGRNIDASEWMLPSYDYQPSAFEASVSSNINNVTGNGTNYNVVFNSEKYDYLGEYNNTTGYFVAQKTGKYQISTQIGIAVSPGVTTYEINLNTSTTQYRLFRGDTDSIVAGTGTVFITGSAIVDLVRGQFVVIQINVNGLGADTVDVLAESRIQGHWVSR